MYTDVFIPHIDLAVLISDHLCYRVGVCLDW